jgi:hypothetical protein
MERKTAKQSTDVQQQSARQDEVEPASTENQQLLLRRLTDVRARNQSGLVDPKSVMSLQRRIGNQAVQRLLAASKRPVARKPKVTIPPVSVLNIDLVQRKVGFEFEADAWLSYKVQRPLTQQEQQIRDTNRNAVNATATTAGGFTKPPQKGEVIESIGTGVSAGPGTGFQLQADEKDADHGDLEFVTKPFAEDQTGYEDLRSTLEMMRSMMNLLVSKPLRDKLGAYIWPDEHGLNANYLFRLGDRPMKLKPQVTGGIGLDKISSVMENMGVVPGESQTEATNRSDGRGKLLAANSMMAKILGAAPGMARTAISSYLPARIATWNLVQNDFQDTSKLEGLVSMAVAYIKAGANVQFSSYPKVLAPLMSRTDFATLFEMLPQEQKDYFKTHADVFRDLIIAAANSNISFSKRDGIVGADTPLIQHFLKADTDLIKALKIGRWLNGMTEGKDYLSVSGFQQMLKEDAGTPGALTKKQVETSEELEGFGALGSKTDGGNAIVEFRGIPTMLAHTEIEAFALNFHKYIQNLNSRAAGQTYYGKQA